MIDFLIECAKADDVERFVRRLAGEKNRSAAVVAAIERADDKSAEWMRRVYYEHFDRQDGGRWKTKVVP